MQYDCTHVFISTRVFWVCVHTKFGVCIKVGGLGWVAKLWSTNIMMHFMRMCAISVFPLCFLCLSNNAGTAIYFAACKQITLQGSGLSDDLMPLFPKLRVQCFLIRSSHGDSREQCENVQQRTERWERDEEREKNKRDGVGEEVYWGFMWA